MTDKIHLRSVEELEAEVERLHRDFGAVQHQLEEQLAGAMTTRCCQPERDAEAALADELAEALRKIRRDNEPFMYAATDDALARWEEARRG